MGIKKKRIRWALRAAKRNQSSNPIVGNENSLAIEQLEETVVEQPPAKEEVVEEAIVEEKPKVAKKAPAKKTKARATSRRKKYTPSE